MSLDLSLTPPSRSPRKPLHEALVTFVAVIAVIFALVFTLPHIPWLNQFLLAIVTLLFYGAASWRIDTHPNPPHFGPLHSICLRHLLQATVIALVLFPLFFAGLFLWQTKVHDQDFHFSTDNYFQWPHDISGAPPIDPSNAPSGIYLWAERSRISLLITDPESSAESEIILSSSTPFNPRSSGVTSHDISGERATQWAFTLRRDTSFGTIQLDSIPDLSIKQLPLDDSALSLPLYLGKDAHLSDGDPITFSRGYAWLLLWLLTQIFLVAFGEEWFYRGYLQQRLTDAFSPDPISPLPSSESFPSPGEPVSFGPCSTGPSDPLSSPGAPISLTLAEDGHRSNSWIPPYPVIVGILVTSLLFALGHLVIPINGAFRLDRAAVFFPSLLFGYLRYRTNALTGPILLHALSNMMVIISTPHFI